MSEQAYMVVIGRQPPALLDVVIVAITILLVFVMGVVFGWGISEWRKDRA